MWISTENFWPFSPPISDIFVYYYYYTHFYISAQSKNTIQHRPPQYRTKAQLLLYLAMHKQSTTLHGYQKQKKTFCSLLLNLHRRIHTFVSTGESFFSPPQFHLLSTLTLHSFIYQFSANPRLDLIIYTLYKVSSRSR